MTSRRRGVLLDGLILLTILAPTAAIAQSKAGEATGLLGLSYDGWVAAFTGALTLATVLMGWFTYLAAKVGLFTSPPLIFRVFRRDIFKSFFRVG